MNALEVVPPHFPIISDSALRLIEHLKTVPVGGIVPWSEVSRIQGDDYAKHRQVYATACQKLLVDHGLHFAVVARVGLRHLTASDVIDRAKEVPIRCHRLTRRASKKLSKVNPDGLEPGLQKAFYFAVSCVGALAMFTANKCQRSLEKRFTMANNTLPPKDVLKLWEKEV